MMRQENCIDTIAPPHSPRLTDRHFGPVIVTVVRAVMDTLVRWQERSNMRKHLSEMDDRMLKDIGISSAQVRWEAAKPFWRP
jgi:uncharacterized protein YjiS (DUF1127 family)